MFAWYRMSAMVLLTALAVAVGAEPVAVPAAEAAAAEPRLGLVITRAEAVGAVSGKLARMSLKLEAEAYCAGEQSALLFGGDVAVTRWSVKTPLLCGDARVGHGSRVLDQSLDATQRDRQGG